MQGSLRGYDARVRASSGIAFRITKDVGTQEYWSFGAQWLACSLLYRRFADDLTDTNARLEANVTR